MIKQSFNIKSWIDEYRDLLKPPIGNKCVYETADDLIVMVVGGPNARRDFHYNFPTTGARTTLAPPSGRHHWNRCRNQQAKRTKRWVRVIL